MTERARNELVERRLVDGLFYILLAVLVVLAGWLGARHDHYWDWTQSRRNTLSEESAEVLAKLDAPLHVTVFADRHHPIAKGLSSLLARYRRSKADMDVTFVDPQLFPEQARAADISLLGQILLEYRGRRETVSVPDEGALTAAIARLGHGERPWIAVLEGHGERAVDGTTGSDIGRFAEVLRGRGFRLQPLDLTTAGAVPGNAQLLIVSNPTIGLFPGEEAALVQYLKHGGNLLLLADPGDRGGLQRLLDYLGVDPLPGIMVDANVAELNIQDPTVALVADYPDHPLTQGLSDRTLFPGTIGFADWAAEGWSLAMPLKTLKNSWNETGPIRGNVSREGDLGELPGPVPLALVLSRPAPQGKGEQRIILMGDGDFLSNAYLDTAGNRALALRIIQWLTQPEGPASVPTRTLSDRELGLTRNQILVVGGGSLVVLPALLLIIGLVIRWRRRQG